jgi:hypothetical protein
MQSIYDFHLGGRQRKMLAAQISSFGWVAYSFSGAKKRLLMVPSLISLRKLEILKPWITAM